MTQLDRFERDLLDDLLELHPTVSRRARRVHAGRRVAVVAAVAVVLVAAPVLIDIIDPTLDPSTGVLSIAEAEGGVTITVLDAAADPQEMTRQLETSGIPGEVRAFPTSPYNVGRWLGVQAGGPRGQRVAMQAGGQPSDLFVPHGVEPGLVLFVGRQAADGEDYRGGGAGNLFSPREPLHCRGLYGADPATVEAALEEDGIAVVLWGERRPPASNDQSPEPDGRPDHGWVVDGNLMSNSTAQVIVTFSPELVEERLVPHGGVGCG